MKMLWHSMLLYRRNVAHNSSPEARLKNRVGAWCTYLGMNVSYLLGRVYRMNSDWMLARKSDRA